MIDGIVSGKLLRKPKEMQTKRGTRYAIGKMNVFGYRVGNLNAHERHGDLIAFDKEVCRRLLAMNAGETLSVCGVIVPVDETEFGETQTVLKIVVHSLPDGYAHKQALGKGRLLSLKV